MNNLPPEVQGQYDELSTQIGRATLAGNFFGYFSATELEKQRFKLVRKWAKKQKDKRALADAESAASSTYYAASGNARANGKTFRAVRYLLWAAYYSNGAVDSAGGIKNLSTNQLDVRASICRKMWCLGQARDCVAEALSRDDITDETRVLLLLHQARDRRWRGAREKFEEIDDIVKRGTVPALTRVRASRAKLSYWKKIKIDLIFIEGLEAETLALAKAAKLEDQVVKIRAERRQ